MTYSAIYFAKTGFMHLGTLNITIVPQSNRGFVVSLTITDAISIFENRDGHICMDPVGSDSFPLANSRSLALRSSPPEHIYGFGELSP